MEQKKLNARTSIRLEKAAATVLGLVTCTTTSSFWDLENRHVPS